MIDDLIDNKKKYLYLELITFFDNKKLKYMFNFTLT